MTLLTHFFDVFSALLNALGVLVLPGKFLLYFLFLPKVLFFYAKDLLTLFHAPLFRPIHSDVPMVLFLVLTVTLFS